MTTSRAVTVYLDCAETQGCSLEGCISTTLVYLVYLVLPCFNHVLVSPFHLLYTPSLCIYRYSRATFTIKSLVQYPHTALLQKDSPLGYPIDLKEINLS